MADERIEDITGGQLTSPADDDKLVILDTSDTTDDPDGTAKYIELSDLISQYSKSGSVAEDPSWTDTGIDHTVENGFLLKVHANTERSGLYLVSLGSSVNDDHIAGVDIISFRTTGSNLEIQTSESGTSYEILGKI